MLFYTIWDLVELAFVWLIYPETKGPTLEEVARIFDGDEAVAHVDLRHVEKELQNFDDDYIAAAQAPIGPREKHPA